MPLLIRLTRADNNTTADEADEVTINVKHIIMIEDNVGRDHGASRIILDNGKALLVNESQDDIRDLAAD